MPLIDEIIAQGKTLQQLDHAITEKLTEYVRNPDVAVSLQRIGGDKVLVLGEVRNPGVYALSASKTVLEAAALANGFTRDAVLKSVIIVRGGLQNPKPERINLVKVLKSGKMDKSLQLRSNDIVYVPSTFISNLSYVMEKIISPISKGSTAYRTLNQQ